MRNGFDILYVRLHDRTKYPLHVIGIDRGVWGNGDADPTKSVVTYDGDRRAVGNPCTRMGKRAGEMVWENNQSTNSWEKWNGVKKISFENAHIRLSHQPSTHQVSTTP